MASMVLAHMHRTEPVRVATLMDMDRASGASIRSDLLAIDHASRRRTSVPPRCDPRAAAQRNSWGAPLPALACAVVVVSRRASELVERAMPFVARVFSCGAFRWPGFFFVAWSNGIEYPPRFLCISIGTVSRERVAHTRPARAAQNNTL